MVSSRPSAVDSAAARPPAATRPEITYGRPPISGVASTMMSPPIFISLSWRMPSLLMSTTDSSAGSTSFQLAIQAGNLSNGVPTRHVEHLVLHQHRQGRRREVQQEDEEQRPGDRITRLLHAGRRVVAHQDVRQRRRPHHQAEDQRQEVAPRLVEGLLRRRVAVRVPGEHLRVVGHAAQRLGAVEVRRALALVQASLAAAASLGTAASSFSAAATCDAIGVGGLEVGHFLLGSGLVGSQRGAGCPSAWRPSRPRAS